MNFLLRETERKDYDLDLLEKETRRKRICSFLLIHLFLAGRILLWTYRHLTQESPSTMCDWQRHSYTRMPFTGVWRSLHYFFSLNNEASNDTNPTIPQLPSFSCTFATLFRSRRGRWQSNYTSKYLCKAISTFGIPISSWTHRACAHMHTFIHTCIPTYIHSSFRLIEIAPLRFQSSATQINNLRRITESIGEQKWGDEETKLKSSSNVTQERIPDQDWSIWSFGHCLDSSSMRRESSANGHF